MKRFAIPRLSRGLLAACLLIPLAQAQDTTPPRMDAEQQAMMAAWEKASTPGAQHKQLAEQFAGTWNVQQRTWIDPAAAPMSDTGQAVSTPEFGGRHVRTLYTGQMMGQPYLGSGLLSYDNVTGRYINTWIDNASTGQFTSLGDYDAATRTYTFKSEAADPFAAGKSVSVRTLVRFTDADHYVMEMYDTRDGKENKSMEIEYTRAK